MNYCKERTHTEGKRQGGKKTERLLNRNERSESERASKREKECSEEESGSERERERLGREMDR